MLCDLYIENAEYQENLMTKYYRKLGHEVVIVASLFDSVVDFNLMRYPSHAIEQDYIVDNVKIYRRKYSINFLNRIRKLSNVFEILNQEKPDLIYAHGVHINLLDAKKYMQKDLSCKLVMDYHGDYSNSGKNFFSKLILHKLIRKYFIFNKVKKYISKIFPINPSSAKFLHEIYGVACNDMEILPLGGDTDLLNSIKDSRVNVRRKLGIADGDFVIFTGGRMSLLRRTNLLIQAFDSLNLSNVHLVIVGDIANDVGTIVKEHIDKNDKIHFLGWQDSVHVYEYMNASDIAVFPRGQSVMWCQAICSGLPLVVGLISNSEFDYLNIYNNVIIIDDEDISADSIRNAVLKIYNDPNLFEQMQNGARKVADEYLDWNKLIAKTIQFKNDKE